MFEKVNPAHPDKIADRIAGALVDLAYKKMHQDARMAAEVLIGHGKCHIIAETNADITWKEAEAIVHRIAGEGITAILFDKYDQDSHLAKNQEKRPRCGDNGIFRGIPMTQEQLQLADVARSIFDKYPTDGKYIINGKKLIICQSNAEVDDLQRIYPRAIVNPLGDWSGGTDTDTGAVNRKLGSDMGDSVTGGGLHGKDLTKADVAVNLCVWFEAQKQQKVIEAICAIGDPCVVINGMPRSYERIIEEAKLILGENFGSFEKFAEWGLI